MSKRIVICADGTWNRPEKDPRKDHPTNVQRIAQAIQPRAADGIAQQAFYDDGLGWYQTPWSSGFAGNGVQGSIIDAYRYVVQNYEPGDELFFFGFSRGAYVVRSLCGLINNCGILKRAHTRLIHSAFDHYKRAWPDYAPAGKASVAFRRQYAQPKSRTVKFVGVWDTVGAMGIPLSVLGLFDNRDEFYDAKLGPNVEVARQALALNERRVDFQPTLWLPREEADVQQVWFAGCHGDVGGGHPPCPDSGSLLAANSLQWMTKQAAQFGLGLQRYTAIGGKADALAPMHESRRTFYRLRERYARPIEPLISYKTSQVSVPTRIHHSVQARWRADGSYRPRALVEHLKSHQDAPDGGWNLVL